MKENQYRQMNKPLKTNCLGINGKTDFFIMTNVCLEDYYFILNNVHPST